MYRKIADLVRHSVIYGLGSLSTRIVGFFLIPVYTRFMTPADYGLLALCTTTASVLSMISLAGIPSALFRSYLHMTDDDGERRRVQATALVTLLATGVAVFGLIVVSRRPLARWILGDAELSSFILLLAVSNLAQVVLQFRNAMFRINEQSTRYSFFTLLAFVINVGLSIALVVGLRQGAWGAMSANALAPAFIALLFLPWCLRHLAGGFSTRILRQLLAYGLPLIPSGIAVWIMNLSDIYMLRIFRDADEVGLYNLGYRFGIGILLVSNAVKVAYPKIVFAEGRTREAPALFSRVTTYYSLGVGALCLVVAVFAPEIVLIADERFREAWRVIPLVVAAYFFNGLVPILEVGMNLTNRMHYLAAIFMGGALLNVTLNVIFIPRYGMMAAAGTTLATYLVLPPVVYLVSARLFPMRLEWSRLGRLALVFLGAGAGAAILPTTALGTTVAAKAALCAATLPALWVLGFFTTEEVAKLRRLLRAARG